MLPYRGLQVRIMAALAIVTLFSVIGAGLVAYWAEREALERQFSLELTSGADYMQQRLEDWLNERQSDVRFLAADSSNQESLWQLLAQPMTPEETQFHLSRLAASLLSMQQARPAYIRILIADAAGEILVAADPAQIGQSVKDAPAFAATLRFVPSETTHAYIEDISYNETLGAYVMCFGYPLFAPNHLVMEQPHVSSTNTSDRDQEAPTALGVVLIAVDMQKTIYPLLKEWRTGQSGTAVLSRAEGEQTRILNEVLGDDAAPLARLLPAPTDRQQAKPAHWAARGAEGMYRTIDHLGAEVLTVYRHIPVIEWGLVFKMDTSEVFAPLHDLIRHVAYIALGVLAIAWLVSIVIARTLTKPLAELVTTARMVAAGQTPIYTALDRRDEIGILARSFRDMVDTLQRQQQQLKAANLENARLVHQLQSWNAELEQRVEERTHKLAEANRRLMVLDKMKADLLCSISHELRNPITNLKLQLDLLHHHIDAPRRQKYLTALVTQVDALARLVADMLELIQIDGMQNQLVFTTVNFTMLVDDAVKSAVARLRQADKPLPLTFEPPSKPLFVRGEQTQLALIVTHLLRNAVNFTQNGTINVQMWEDEGEGCLQVQDTGIGIAKEDLPHIFDRFFRGVNVSQSTIPGSGLGLSVVAKILKLHGGRVTVESELGQGSTFRLWLPCTEAPRALQGMGLASSNKAKHRIKVS